MKSNKLRLLIVDDSVFIALRLKEFLLELENVIVVGHAENYYDAVLLTQAVNPDVMLLDIHLNGKSGIDVLAHLKQNNNSVRVIMFTNYADGYFKNSCLRLGADYFLDKSKDFDKIPKVLEQIAAASRKKNPSIT